MERNNELEDTFDMCKSILDIFQDRAKLLAGDYVAEILDGKIIVEPDEANAYISGIFDLAGIPIDTPSRSFLHRKINEKL